MDDDSREDRGAKQPENLVRYKSRKELYSILHTCIMLRELPELTPEELEHIRERERDSR